MTGAPSKGSASISAGAIVFNAPAVFEGYSEIGYRITDANWNIDFLGTVNVYVQTQSSGGGSVANPITTNPTTEPPSLGNNTKTPSFWGNTVFVISAILVAVGGIGYLAYNYFKKR